MLETLSTPGGLLALAVIAIVAILGTIALQLRVNELKQDGRDIGDL